MTWQRSHPSGWGKIFWLWIYPFQVILRASLVFVAVKPPSPQDEGKFFDFGSIHFRWFWASLVFGAEKPPPRMREKFWLWIYPFQVILSKFGFCGRKALAPPRMREMFLILDLSISGDFGQVRFLWQKRPPSFLPFGEILGSCCSTWCNFMDWYFMYHWISHRRLLGRKAPPPGWGKIFWLQIYPFQAILSNFGFCGRKAPHPHPQDEGKFFDFGSIHFRWFWASLVFVAEKPSPQDEGKFFDFGSIHFRWFWASLVFVAEKPPPPRWGNIFWLWIYLLQAILSKFGFCGRKAPPPLFSAFWWDTRLMLQHMT